MYFSKSSPETCTGCLYDSNRTLNVPLKYSRHKADFWTNFDTETLLEYAQKKSGKALVSRALPLN